MEPIETVDRALITAIQEQVLAPELQGSIVDEVVARIRSIPAVTERFREKERESVALERTLAGVRSVAKVESIDFRALDRVPSGAFGNLEATIRSDDVRACAVLSSLLSGRVLFHPTETEVGGKPRRAHRIEASLVIGRLLVSSDDQQCRAFTSPTGFAHPAPASFPEVRVVVPPSRRHETTGTRYFHPRDHGLYGAGATAKRRHRHRGRPRRERRCHRDAARYRARCAGRPVRRGLHAAAPLRTVSDLAPVRNASANSRLPLERPDRVRRARHDRDQAPCRGLRDNHRGQAAEQALEGDAPEAGWDTYLPFERHDDFGTAQSDVLKGRALECMAGPSPHFCYIGAVAPHGPLPGPERCQSQPIPARPPTVTEKRWSQRMSAICGLDDLVASVVEARGANTYVIFTSDNGWMYGENERVGKSELVLDAAQVPLIVWGPDVVPAHRREIVSLVDITTTVLRLANVGRVGGEGRSFLPLLRNDNQARWTGTLIVEGQ